jgi:hypothetical protein
MAELLTHIYPSENLEFRNFNALEHLRMVRWLPIIYHKGTIADGEEYILTDDKRRMPVRVMTLGTLGGTDTVEVFGQVEAEGTWYLLDTLNATTTEVTINLPFLSYKLTVTLAGASVPVYACLGG